VRGDDTCEEDVAGGMVLCKGMMLREGRGRSCARGYARRMLREGWMLCEGCCTSDAALQGDDATRGDDSVQGDDAAQGDNT
jgi:hypothetical protein